MAITFHQVTALPGTLVGDAIYAVATGASAIELYITNNDGSLARRIINEADVQALIDAATIAAGSSFVIVADITERDALGLTDNKLVLVLDASADVTVGAGSALYAWRQSTTSFIKVSEFESLDITVNWSDIQGRPSSSAAAIDAAVANSHTHGNKTEIDKIGQDGDGNLTYDGNLPHIGWDTNNW